MATFTPTRGKTLPDTAAKADFHDLIDLMTGTVTGIVNADVSASAAIAASKLDLSSIAQVVAFSSKILKLAKGADVASAASITLGEDGNFFDITGTTTITSVTIKQAGTIVTLQFDGVLTFTDGSNLKLNGNFVTAAESTITLISDGTNWFELARSPFVSATPQALTDGATISVDATTGKHFRVTLAGNRTLANPTGATDGQLLLFEIKQDGTGSRTITLGSNYVVPADIGTVTLSTAASTIDFLLVVYHSTDNKFRVLGFTKGFAS